MSKSNVRKQVSQTFAEFAPLAYWIARRWAERLLESNAQHRSESDLEELAQDAVCRAYDRFVKRHDKQDCPESDRKAWVGQCVMHGVRDAMRAKSRFGSITSPCAVRDDVMNRCVRIPIGMVHGTDEEKRNALGDVEAKPVAYDAQRWELEQVINLELPADLRPTAIYQACGLTQAESAALQGVTDRTVRNRLRDIRVYLNPPLNAYAVICDAVRACLDQPRKQSGQSLQTLLSDGAA